MPLAQDGGKRSSPFMLYALLAADEALRDASWLPSTPQQRRATGVCLGNGMSCTAEVAEAGRIILVRGGAGRGRAGWGGAGQGASLVIASSTQPACCCHMVPHTAHCT